MHNRYTGVRWRNKNTWKNKAKNNFIFCRFRIILESAPRTAIFCLATETKGQTFRGIPGFYSTSSYAAVIFSAHLVAVKCEVFTTSSTREIQLCARPATQLTRSPLLPANHVRQSIAHARIFKWKGSSAPGLSVGRFTNWTIPVWLIMSPRLAFLHCPYFVYLSLTHPSIHSLHVLSVSSALS